MIKIQVNGETREIPAGMELGDLLKHLSLPTERVAVELNRMVVRRAEWSSVRVSENDRVEVIHFVGGG